MNHLPKLFSEKPWGFILDPQENRSWYCHTAFFPSKCSHNHAVHDRDKTHAAPRRNPSPLLGMGRFGFLNPGQAAQSEQGNPWKNEPQSKATGMGMAGISLLLLGMGGWHNSLKHVYTYTTSGVYIYILDMYVYTLRNRKVPSITRLTDNEQWVLQQEKLRL